MDIYFAMYSGSEELTFAGGNLEMVIFAYYFFYPELLKLMPNGKL